MGAPRLVRRLLRIIETMGAPKHLLKNGNDSIRPSSGCVGFRFPFEFIVGFLAPGTLAPSFDFRFASVLLDQLVDLTPKPVDPGRILCTEYARRNFLLLLYLRPRSHQWHLLNGFAGESQAGILENGGNPEFLDLKPRSCRTQAYSRSSNRVLLPTKISSDVTDAP